MAKAFKQTDDNFPSFLVAVVVCLLNLLACFLPCIDCGPGFQSSDPGFPDFEAGWNFGWQILLLGWGGGNNGVPWSANVFLALGLACLWKRWLRAAAWLGVLASLLGLTTWWVRRFNTLMVGYYIWQASLLVLAVGAALSVRKSKRKSGSWPLPEAQKQDLQRRLSAYEADRHTGSTWEEVKARLSE